MVRLMTAISSQLIKVGEEDVTPERESSSSCLRRMARRRLSMLLVRVRMRRRHVLTDGKEVPVKGKTSDGISSKPRERLGAQDL